MSPYARPAFLLSRLNHLYHAAAPYHTTRLRCSVIPVPHILMLALPICHACTDYVTRAGTCDLSSHTMAALGFFVQKVNETNINFRYR